MPRRRDIAIAWVGAVLLMIFSGAVSAKPRPSRIIFPEQYIPLRFSHALHIGKAKMSCESCHTEIRRSASSLDNNLPQERDCVACHEIERAAVGEQPQGTSTPCIRCHPSHVEGRSEVERVMLPIPNLKFSHAAHLARGTSCDTCHGDFTAVQEASVYHLPRMATCLGCHDGKQAEDACSTCHLAQAGGQLQTAFPGLGALVPSGDLRGAAHDLEFRSTHKYAAQNDSGFCATCHKKDDCTDCHNGVVKPMDFHAGDYVRMHAIDARRNSPDCSSCHRLQTFCQGCHSRMGVADDEKGGQFRGTGAYHPPGWNQSGLAGRDFNHHSFEAQRNIKQCASCHRESFCTQCHSAEPGMPRVNPHPRNWLGSRRCQALAKRNPRMCLRCHIEQDLGC